MSRGIIFSVGLFALTLLALLCIPRHLPVTSSATGHPAFSAHIENGQLTLSGAVASEDAKVAVIARAQDLSKNLRLRVTDNLEIIEHGEAAGWEATLPALLTQMVTLQHHQATISLSGQTATVKGAAASTDAKTKLLHDMASLLGTSVHVQDQLTVASAGSVSQANLGSAGQPSATPHVSRAQVQAGLDEVLRGEHIAFESNSAVLTHKGRAVIDKLVPALKRARGQAMMRRSRLRRSATMRIRSGACNIGGMPGPSNCCCGRYSMPHPRHCRRCTKSLAQHDRCAFAISAGRGPGSMSGRPG